MNLFVDTGGWVALFDKSDKYHRIARSAFENRGKRPARWITSDYVLDETLTHLRNATGTRVAVEAGRWVLQTPYVRNIRIDEEIWSAAWKMFQDYTDKEWSFTDCTSFILMRQHNLSTAFAFDHHFRQAGFQLWPG